VPNKNRDPEGLPPADGESLPDWLADETFADEEVRMYLWAAARCGLEVSHWARATLNAAARAVLDVQEDH
jgi:hypothetical protein